MIAANKKINPFCIIEFMATLMHMLFIKPKPHNFDAPHVFITLGLAAIFLGQALQSGNGFLNVLSLFYLTVTLIFFSLSLFATPTFGHNFFARYSFPILVLGLMLQIYQLAFTYTGNYQFLSLLPNLWQLRCLILIVGVLALISLVPQKWISSSLQNTLTLLVFLGILFAGVWVIQNVPYPFIDVFVVHQNSARALTQGINPYSLITPNIFGSLGDEAYGSKLSQNGFLTIGNPYPPLSIFISSIGYILAGDARYSHLFAFVLSGALIAFLSIKSESKLAAYIFLFTPKSLYVIEQSWTEPIVILFLTSVVYSSLRKPSWLPILVGLFFASKQYLLFVFPLVLFLFPLHSPITRWMRHMGLIFITAVTVTIPFALWDFPSFFWNVGQAQWYLLFRLDALSYLSAYAKVTDTEPSQFIAFAALAFAGFLVWHFLPRRQEGFVTGLTFCMIMFFAFGKQAFCNYYFLVIAGICCSLSALQTQEETLSMSGNMPDK